MRRFRDVTAWAAVGAASGAVYGCFGWPERVVPLWLQPLPLFLLGGMAVWGTVLGALRGDPHGDALPGAFAGFIAGATAGVLGLGIAFCIASVPGLFIPPGYSGALAPLWVLARPVLAAAAGLAGGRVAVAFVTGAVALVAPSETER
jgi:hypothetical protein